MGYFEALTRAMALLALDPRALFVGQSVKFGGQRAHATFAGVPPERRIEMPICEDFTVGFCTGLALQGYVPLCFIPRWDFLLLAANQLVNHLDKLAPQAKVIIRTAVGAREPLDPGPQHTQNHSLAFQLMLNNVRVVELFEADAVLPEYKAALERAGPTIMVEHMERY